MNPSSRLRVVLVLFFAGFFICRNAYGYLDPGSGSYFLQILIASLLAAGFAIKTFWLRIKLFLIRIFQRKPPKNETR